MRSIAVADSFNSMADEVEHVVTELRAEERLKSQFVSDVSHELRTPLTAIRGAAETLLDGDVAASDQERFLTSIVAESDRLTRLANDLLTLQKIEGATGELPASDHRLENGRRASGVGVRSSTRGPRGQVLDRRRGTDGAWAIRTGLQQVIANLVDNASRHVDRGGHVEVRLESDAEWALLSVIDDGPGIPEEDVAESLRPLLPLPTQSRPLDGWIGPRTRDREGDRHRSRRNDPGNEPVRRRLAVHREAPRASEVLRDLTRSGPEQLRG